MRKIWVLGAIFLAGCAANKDSIRQALKEDPEILYEALAQNPARLAEVMQKAATEARRVAQEKQQQDEDARLAQEMKNPVKPEIAADRAVYGDRNAPFMVVEYSDFQCPYCKKGFETVEELKKKYGKKLAFMYKHLPLPFHPMAMPAAKRFEAIALQNGDKAYQFHDQVFKQQDQLSQNGEKFMDGVAKKLGVDMARMKKDMEGDKVKARIEADMAEAKKYDIQGTPGFVVAGVTIRGAYPTSTFEAILDKRNVAGEK